MTKVFIGGSRRTSRLSAAVRQRLDRIIERRFPVLIGDANGADKAVQNYLCARGYDRVEVFCMDGLCRNNVGDWTTRAVSAPPGAKGFQYYSTKDEEMARESTIGFMLWDGRSKGTLANISRLLDRGKRVVVYIAPTREFETLANSNDWESFACKWTKNSHRPQRGHMRTPERQPSTSRQAGLF
jgi:adenine-specific DNA-methyltransferase